MQICYHTGKTGPGAFQAFMASKGKEFLENLTVEDPVWAIQHYIENATEPYASEIIVSAFLKLVAPHPILFRPTAQHCEALENITPNFTIDQYTQPYPVCIVELPEDYAVNRLTPLSAADMQSNPLFAIVVKLAKGDSHFLAIAVFGTTERASCHYWTGKQKPLNLNPELEGVNCAALNFLMMVEDAEVIEASIPAKRVKRKGYRHRKKLIQQSQVFTLQDQSIKLFSTPETARDYLPSDEPHGTPKRPHWRKGHWRFYEDGRRVRINPILINKHKLASAA